MTVALAAGDTTRDRRGARDQCLRLVAGAARADLVILETGVAHYRWGGGDLPDARLPVLADPTSLPDAGRSPGYARHPLVVAGVRSLASVPVRLEGSSCTLGTLWVASRRPNAFGPETLGALEPFAVIVAELAAPPGEECALRAFVEALPVPAVAVHQETVFPNVAATRLTGLPEGHRGSIDDWFSHLFGDEAASAHAMYAFDRHGGFPEPRVVPVRRSPRGERLFEWASRRLGDFELWLFHDVTERAWSQERFRMLFDQSSTALIVYDEGGIIDLNPAAVALLGHRSRGELLKKNPWALGVATQPDGEASAAKGAKMERIARELGSQRFEWVAASGGEGQKIEVTLTAVTLGPRQVLLAEWHDISERARYEAALRQARDAAVKHAEAKARFLATMSHEIRTPMNGVIGMTRLLMDTALSDQQREYAETIRACGEGMLSLVNDVLDFSKLDAGKVELEALSFSPRELAEDVLAVVAEAAESKGLELSGFIAPMVPAVGRGDSTRIRQVLLNLLSNAVKFTLAGEVSLKVVARPEADGRCTLVFTVRDTGIGIAPEARRTLFDAFCQADASTTRRFGGSGLGLAISQRLVGLMGGTIEVASGPGGSTFTFTVGVEVVEASATGTELSGQRVLLAVDRPSVAESVGVLLRERGAVVQVVDRWTDAEALAPDTELAVIDLKFAGGRGLELARALKRAGKVVGLLTPLAAPAELAREVDFVVPLPARRGPLVAQVGRAQEAPPGRLPPKTSPSQLRALGARVLVAEDNPVNQRVVRGLLAKLGCEAVVVPDGARAVETSREGRFDVILMDCQMPVMDGFEATRRIRAHHGRRTPIVALTAGVLEGDRQRCLDAGMDEFLSKPLRMEDLERVLAGVVQVEGP